MSIECWVLFVLVLVSAPLSLLASPNVEVAQHVGHLVGSPSAFVEAVRQATEQFRDVRNVPAAYGPTLGCVSGPELHLWAWRNNPKGVFVDWNPRVSREGQ